MKRICIAIFIVCLVAGHLNFAAEASAAPPDARTYARLEIWKAVSAGRAVSATIALLDNDRFVFSEGFAMADRGRSLPVESKTLFNIGSISKVYCATAIMVLVDEGKVDLDKPVTHYLPEFTMADERYKSITVRMLLNHSSGLPGGSYANSFGIQYNESFLPDTLKTLAQSRLKHEPGEMSVYCNDGFSLAEMIVERVSGQKFTQFLSERVFTPLALQSTHAGVGMLPAGFAAPIARYYDPSGKPEPFEAVSFLGSGGLSATAEDLCRFADSFSGQGKQILTTKSRKEILSPQLPAFHGKLRNPGISYGLGWDFAGLPEFSKQGLFLLGKSGGTGNYSSMVFTLPEHRISIAVIAAGPQAGSMDIALNVLEAYLVEKGLFRSSPKSVLPPVAAKPMPDSLKAYEGYYAADGGSVFKLQLDREKNRLLVFNTEMETASPVLTAVYNEGLFYDSQRKKYYLDSVDGMHLLVHSSQFADLVSFQKIEPLAEPRKLKVELNKTVWLRRNVEPFEARMSVFNHWITARTFSDLPGYVDFAGIKRIESADAAGMNLKTVRDSSELHLFEKDGATWAWVSGLIFSPGKQVEPLKTPLSQVTLAQNGMNEWRKVSVDAVLSFLYPSSGRVIVFSPEDTVLFDSLVDLGEVFAPAGSLVELAGRAGDRFSIAAGFNRH